MIISIDHKTYGTQECLIDEEDYAKIKHMFLHLWSSPRHYGYYVMGHIPGEWTKAHRIHRLIMDAKPGEIVDHINGNPLDNRRCNLRITTSLVNNQNARKRKDGVTSKYKGVSLGRWGKWIAQIQVNGKNKSLGNFKTEDEAARAYNNALDLYDIQSPRNKLADLK